MKNIINILVAFLYILIFCIRLYPQELDCGYNGELTVGGIPTNTQGSGRFFRVLVIYIAFNDDIVTGPSENI